jgi:hypothetical protein
MAKPPTAARRLPFEGAMVIYVDPHMGDTYPAVVTHVIPASVVPMSVLLTSFPRGASPYPVKGPVAFDPAGPRNTWHWPRET